MSNSNQFRGGIKSVQRGIITITAANTSVTATISAVNTAKTELRYLGGGNYDSNLGAVFGRVVLTNSTTITASPSSSGTLNGNVIVSWELTEWY